MREFLYLGTRFRGTQIVDDDFPLMRDRFDAALTSLLETLPRIICLCGSTRFYEEFQRANFRETMAGNIVLSVGFYPHAECSKEAHGEDVGITPAQKTTLDELHKRKIDLADEILVLNVGAYIGDSTRSEIAYAKAQGKAIRWLETPCAEIIIHADAETHIDQARALCGAENVVGTHYVWRYEFAEYECAAGETKCSSCVAKVAQ